MRTKRALWSLALAFVFGLGVLAAQVRADLFLPLVWGVGAQTTPTPTVEPSGMVRVVNLHCHASEGQVYGELVNETAHTVRVEGVNMYLVDAEGLPVGNQTGSAMVPLLLPGQRTPFVVDCRDGLPAWDPHVIYVSWDPIDRLTVESASLTRWLGDWWEVTAVVRNQLSVRVESLRVGAVLYGPSGDVVGYDESWPWESLGPLEPEETLTTTFGFSAYNWDTSITPTSCGVIAFP